METRRDNPGPTRARGGIALALGGGITALAAAMLLDWPAIIGPVVASLLLLGLLNRRQLAVFASPWLWLGLAVVLVVPVWLFGASRAGAAENAAYGPAALRVGVTMALRVVTTLAAMLLITGCVAPARVATLIGRLAGREVGLACGIGINLLPAMLETVRRTTLALRLRGGWRRKRLANLRRLVTAIGVQTVRMTEDVAEALLLAQAGVRHEEDDGDSREDSGERKPT